VPVTYSLQDGVLVEGKGSVVEWMVKMRRLPDNRMMDYLIRSSKLSPADIHAVSTHLARFYKNCAHVEMKESEYISKLMSEIHNNHDTLSIADYSFAQEQLEYLYRMLCTFVCNSADLFRLRIQKGCIVDGHGDLRPEHVCIESVNHVTIFDCLQFSRELRIVDCVDEISFLALECERMGAPGTGYEILKTYFETTGDYPPDALINFYKAYRASMWARLALYRTKELPQYHWGKWLEKAHKYIDLAEKCARHLPIHAC
jgi:aminoglycoside phosphotransferase family enzyme